MFSQKYLNQTLGGMTEGSAGFGDIDWNSIIQQAFATGSQAISAYSGAHGGIQVGYNPQQGGVFSIQQTQPNLSAENALYGGGVPAGAMTAQQIAALNASRGGVAEDAVGSIASFVSQHP